MTIKIEWIEIPEGEFIYGLSQAQSNELLERLRSTVLLSEAARVEAELQDEVPEKNVYLDTFYISRFPITNAQFLAFLESDFAANFRTKQSGKLSDVRKKMSQGKSSHPVLIGSGWEYARAFCDWIGARLPSSFEWEKAGRGTDGRLYPWGNEWDAKRGNFISRDLVSSEDAGRIPPGETTSVNYYSNGQSPYGVMDMMGNVFEFTETFKLGKNFYRGEVITTQLAVARGHDSFLQSERPEFPDWIRHRITQINYCQLWDWPGGLIGFRPVLSKWRKEIWMGHTPSF